MKFRYYTNEAGDVMSGLFHALGVSEEEMPLFDDPDLTHFTVRTVHQAEADKIDVVLDLIDAGLVENDSTLVNYLLKQGILE